MRPAVAVVMAAAVVAVADVTRASVTVDFSRASVTAVVIVAIVVASVTLRPYGHLWTANKKMILASSYDNIFRGNFNTLRGLLQDHDGGHHHGHWTRQQGWRAASPSPTLVSKFSNLLLWFQIFVVCKFVRQL